MSDSFFSQFGQHSLRERLCRWCHIVERYDHKVFSRTGRCDGGQKLRGHSRGHFGKFSTPSRLSTRAKVDRAIPSSMLIQAPKAHYFIIARGAADPHTFLVLPGHFDDRAEVLRRQWHY